MRALTRIVVTLVALGALVGCTDTMADREAARQDYKFNQYATEAVEGRREHELRRAEEERSIRTSVYGDLDCEDFGSRAEAQVYLESHPYDTNYLDGDGDGIACEWGS